MSLEESNKKHIRQHISDHEQAQFFDFFVKIDDHNLFNQWPLKRTQQVVQSFKGRLVQKEEKQANTMLKVQSKTSDTHSIGNISTKKQLSVVSQKLVRSASVGKKDSAFNFLKDVEEKVLRSPSKDNSSPPSNKYNVKDNIWMNFQVSPAKEKKKNLFDKDLFENFDSGIISPEKTKDANKVESPLKLLHTSSHVTPSITPNLTQKIQLKRSQQIKFLISTDIRKPKNNIRSGLKQKKVAIPDKIFKWKVNEEIPCKLLQSSFEGTSIAITGHEMVHRTLLPDYAIYIITVHPTNTLCKRTYDDFVELKTVLDKLYPGVKVPSLDSGSWFSESDISLINKNKTSLEIFMNDLIEHPLLSRTDIVALFLSNKDHKVIEKTLEEYDEAPEIASLSQIYNNSGLLSVKLSQQTNKAVEQLPKWKKMFENFFQKHIDLIATLTSHFQSLKGTYTQMTKLSSSFITKFNQLNELKTLIDFSPLEQLLDKQISYFNKERSHLEKNITNIKEKYSATLKYQKLNVTSFGPIIENTHHLTEKYLKRLENQPQSPSSQLTPTNANHHNTKFTSDIWHESDNFTLFQYQLGFLHSQLLEQSQIFNKSMIRKMSQVWSSVFPRSPA